MAASAQAAVSGRGGFTPAWAAVRTRLGLVALLLVLAGVGWWWTAKEMEGMDGGPWTDLGTFAWFIGVWIVMMAAMMFPSVAPTVALYSRMTKSRSPALPILFTSGYLLTWAAVGRWSMMAAERPSMSTVGGLPAASESALAFRANNV